MMMQTIIIVMTRNTITATMTPMIILLSVCVGASEPVGMGSVVSVFEDVGSLPVTGGSLLITGGPVEAVQEDTREGH